MNKHILIVHAQNNPGVISRLSGLLRRKLFNIESMTAGTTHRPGISSLTIVMTGDPSQAIKAAGVIERLVDVLSVEVVQPDECVRREVVIAKIKINSEADEKILAQTEGDILAKEIYREGDICCVELIDTSQKLDQFLENINKTSLEVLDWARSGVVAVKR